MPVVSTKNHASRLHYVHGEVFQQLDVGISEKIPFVRRKQVGKDTFYLILLQPFIAYRDAHQISVSTI
jgi:hypothetical protein